MYSLDCGSGTVQTAGDLQRTQPQGRKPSHVGVECGLSVNPICRCPMMMVVCVNGVLVSFNKPFEDPRW